MSELSEALESVRKKIARYEGKQMNEQNTKTALIHPILGPVRNLVSVSRNG